MKKQAACPVDEEIEAFLDRLKRSTSGPKLPDVVRLLHAADRTHPELVARLIDEVFIALPPEVEAYWYGFSIGRTVDPALATRLATQRFDERADAKRLERFRQGLKGDW